MSQNSTGLAPSSNKESLREFVCIAVHDLREPLRTIRSCSEMLASRGEASRDESFARCLQYVQAGVDRMEILIHDIAEYCYGEVRELDRLDTNMDDVLREARRQLSRELEKTGGTLTQDPLPVVQGDFSALATVFTVLIENACKFRNEEPPRIHVSVTRQQDEWCFSVHDNGQGFDPLYTELVFKPFERLNGGRYPGSGLGLPRARRFIEQHGGRIWGTSRPNAGSTFSFTLPSLA